MRLWGLEGGRGFRIKIGFGEGGVQGECLEGGASCYRGENKDKVARKIII